MGAIGSSSTSSRISRISSTSEAGPGPSALARAAGLVRLIHPFPVLLDGAVTVVLAFVAGAEAGVAAAAGLGMIALQASIGTLNDIVDAERDAGRKPSKPIPAGLVSRRVAWPIAGLAALAGLLLSAGLGVAAFATAVAILAIGAAYDLRFKGTDLSWLPFAIGIPLLPVYAWFAATGTLPAAFGVLVPAAAAAGAGLAIANALADLERDRAAGISSVAVRLGPGRSAPVAGFLQLGVVVASAIAAAWFGARGPGLIVAAAGAVAVLAGVGLGGLVRDSAGSGRERAWELQAIGIGLLATGWLWSLGDAGAL